MNCTDELNYFLDCFMLFGLGNFVVDCPIQSTSSSSVFTSNEPSVTEAGYLHNKTDF